MTFGRAVASLFCLLAIGLVFLLAALSGEPQSNVWIAAGATIAGIAATATIRRAPRIAAFAGALVGAFVAAILAGNTHAPRGISFATDFQDMIAQCLATSIPISLAIGFALAALREVWGPVPVKAKSKALQVLGAFGALLFVLFLAVATAPPFHGPPAGSRGHGIAMSVLRELRQAEEEYHELHGTYATLEQLGSTAPKASRRWGSSWVEGELTVDRADSVRWHARMHSEIGNWTCALGATRTTPTADPDAEAETCTRNRNWFAS